MLNKHKISIALVSFLIIGSAGAQTLADVAARQRAKTLSELYPKVEEPKPAKPENDVPKVKEKRFVVVGTYIEDLPRVLINDRGSLVSLKEGDQFGTYTVVTIHKSNVVLKPPCRKKSRCNSISVHIGEGI
ncbi:hypothetical protein V8Z74_15080 [Comamonas sp. w2-DMI]|uniref:hypothetical protein n=1 Tax=Comamonas sp. w2-DMI TaxID=3126391 RepID=UPI0032E436E6